MSPHKRHLKIFHWWPWIIGPVALLWILMRSGTNPKRLSYPCQRAAMPIAANWFLAMVAFFAGSLLLRRFAKFSAVAILIVGAVWFIGTLPGSTRGKANYTRSLPVWQVEDPVATVFVMDSIPPTSGSLAAGDASVPDEYLSDPAIDTLLAMMETQGIFLHQTATNPSGIVGDDNIVIIKGNFQWNSRNTTSTDRIKGLIWQILSHPDGFSGEIIVSDNTQEIGTRITDASDNNSEDTDQSIIDVVNTFHAKGYPVYCVDWSFLWDLVASEYSEGDYDDGYVYEAATKISYPKFQSPSGDHYISLRHGVWDSVSAVYDSSRLCIVDFPVLKAHGMAGSTIAVKNWIGTLTTAYKSERYGGSTPMHYTYLFGTYALVSRVMAVTYPRLTIVDAAWTTTDGPSNLYWVVNTKMLAASTDPVAASWYTAKFMLTPIARYPSQTDPDLPGSSYNTYLGNWTAFLADSAGFPCTRDSSEISVYDRTVLLGPMIDAIAGTVNPDTVSQGQAVAFAVEVENSGGVGVVLDGSSRFEFTDGTHIYQSSLSLPETLETGTSEVLNFGTVQVPQAIEDSVYPVTMYLHGDDFEGAGYADTIVTTGANRVVVEIPAQLGIMEVNATDDTVRWGEHDIPVAAVVENVGGADALIDSVGLRFDQGATNLDGEYDVVLLNPAASIPGFTTDTFNFLVEVDSVATLGWVTLHSRIFGRDANSDLGTFDTVAAMPDSWFVKMSELFIRGDLDTVVGISMGDAIYLLKALYVPGSEIPQCFDASDVDDTGHSEIPTMGDALYLLKYLYVPGAPEPPAPFPACGVDPTEDDLMDCSEHSCMDGR